MEFKIGGRDEEGSCCGNLGNVFIALQRLISAI